jgi:hypothetical protein
LMAASHIGSAPVTPQWSRLSLLDGCGIATAKLGVARTGRPGGPGFARQGAPAPAGGCGSAAVRAGGARASSEGGTRASGSNQRPHPGDEAVAGAEQPLAPRPYPRPPRPRAPYAGPGPP